MLKRTVFLAMILYVVSTVAISSPQGGGVRGGAPAFTNARQITETLVRGAKIVAEAEVVSVGAPRERPYGAAGGQTVKDVDIVFRLTRIYKGGAVAEIGQRVVVARPYANPNRGNGPAAAMMQQAFGNIREQVAADRAAAGKAPAGQAAAGSAMQQIGEKYVVFLIDETTEGINQAAKRANAAPDLPGMARYEMLKFEQEGTTALRVTSGKVQVDSPGLRTAYQGKDAQTVLAEIARFASGGNAP